jgi:hypothetical protein
MESAQLWRLFTTILNGGGGEKLKSGNLTGFLNRIPGVLDKLPHGIVTQNNDGQEVVGKKKRFTFWLLHKILLFKSQTHFTAGADLEVEIDRNCDKILKQILNLLALKDPALFRLVIQHLLILLQGKLDQFGFFRKSAFIDFVSVSDLSEAADILFGDDGGGGPEDVGQQPVQGHAEVTALGPQEEVGDDFATSGLKFTFQDPFKVEALQVQILDVLKHVEVALANLTHDLASRGLWPLVARQLDLGDLDLKKSCLTLLASLMKHNCVTNSPKLQFEVVTLAFDLASAIISKEVIMVKSTKDDLETELVDVLNGHLTFMKKDKLLAKMCDLQSLTFWTEILRNPELTKNFMESKSEFFT